MATSNHRNWLEIAEYISLAGVVMGLAIAFFSQQGIYALLPVCLSLLLNLINRRRLAQLTHQNKIASNQVQQFRSQIEALSIAYAKLEADIPNLVPREELKSLPAKVEKLNQQQNALRLSLVPLQSRLDDLIEQFNKRPELEQIESLVTVIMALKQCIDELPQLEHFSQLSRELQQQVESALAQLSENSARVEQLENAIAQVQLSL
jgi:uncharacterized coiled-coil DUF342 family protein